MPYIDAAMAFAITMLAVAIIVQQLMYFPLKGLRRKQLAETLKAFLNKHVQPVIEKKIDEVEAQLGGQLDQAMAENLKKTRTNLELSQKNFKAMRENIIEKLEAKGAVIAVPSGARTPGETDPNADLKTSAGNAVTATNLGGRAIIRVSADEIIGLIRKSDTGKEIEAALGEKADELFDEMKTRYEQVREVYRGFLRVNARVVAVIVGTLFALLFNINTFTLISVYLSNDEARVAVIEQSSAIQQQFQEKCTIQALQGLPQNSPLVQECSSADAIQQQVALLQDTVPMGWSEQEIQIFLGLIGWAEKDAETALEDGVVVVEEEANQDGIVLEGVPEPAPVAAPAPGQTQAGADGKERPWIYLVVYWLLGCFTTGLLAGLGAPFWYDTVRRITAFKDKVTGAAAGTSPPAGTSAPTGQPKPNTPSS